MDKIHPSERRGREERKGWEWALIMQNRCSKVMQKELII